MRLDMWTRHTALKHKLDDFDIQPQIAVWYCEIGYKHSPDRYPKREFTPKKARQYCVTHTLSRSPTPPKSFGMQTTSFSTRVQPALPGLPSRFTVETRTAMKASATKTKTQPQLLTRVEELKLLSQLEKSGLLSTLEKQGLTLSQIEKAGLLSKAENLGVLSAASSTTTPPLLYTLGLLAFCAGAGIVYYVPDESTAQIAGQLVGAGILLSAGIAALAAGNFLKTLQK